jgi:putative CocE/NonD family hydrolase
MKQLFTLRKNMMIAMRDGIKLATDIYLPNNCEKQFPVILERTPYGKAEPDNYNIQSNDNHQIQKIETASFYVEHGFAVIFQDCRGRYNSEGSFFKYINEAYDGEDTVRWIKQQEWCNGKVGIMGFSYTSHAAMSIGCVMSEGLDALVIDSGGFSNAYLSGIRQGGAYELKQLLWAFNQGKRSPHVQNNPVLKKSLENENIFSWMSNYPLKRHHSLLRNLPEYEEFAFDFWEHGTYDSYWKKLGMNTSEYYNVFIKAPLLLITGWYDPYVKTIVDNYTGLSQNNDDIYLVIGPWMHTNRGITKAGEVDFSKNALITFPFANNYQELKLFWFERNLKENKKKVKIPKVWIFVMGGGTGKKTNEGLLDHGGEWIHSDNWPLPEECDKKYYLHDDGYLNEQIEPRVMPVFEEYIFDPMNPVPSIGGTITSGDPVMVGGAFDQVENETIFGAKVPYLPLEARHDVLVFETEVLTADTIIAGSIRAHLWISSDCVDTDFTIKLIDLYPISSDYPQGFAMNITDGIKRVRYRKSYEHPELMSPNKIYEIEIEAFSTANNFVKGHRIRFDVSSSNYPHFDINHNTGDPEGKGNVMVKARNKVYMDNIHHSYVLLPIIQK